MRAGDYCPDVPDVPDMPLPLLPPLLPDMPRERLDLLRPEVERFPMRLLLFAMLPEVPELLIALELPELFIAPDDEPDCPPLDCAMAPALSPTTAADASMILTMFTTNSLLVQVWSERSGPGGGFRPVTSIIQ